MESNLGKKMFTFMKIGLPFGLVVGVAVGVLRTPPVGVAAAIIGGVLFPAMLLRFAKLQEIALAERAETYEGAAIVHQGPANHFAGAEGRGGWLILTTEALHFKSHKHNIQRHPVTVRLREIASLKAVNTALIIPNGLLVTREDGSRERFVLQERSAWMNALRSQNLSV